MDIFCLIFPSAPYISYQENSQRRIGLKLELNDLGFSRYYYIPEIAVNGSCVASWALNTV